LRLRWRCRGTTLLLQVSVDQYAVI
jgi:hypothetical protein